jgi:hypothetical protein
VSKNPPVWTTIKAAWEYLRTIYGACSALPGLAALLDAKLDLLRISSAIKPSVYFLAVAFVVYVLFAEVSRYIETSNRSKEFHSMQGRARIHLACFVAALGLYWTGTTYFQMNLPTRLWLDDAILFALAVLVAFSFMEITRAFAILGLRIYIATHRP